MHVVPAVRQREGSAVDFYGSEAGGDRSIKRCLKRMGKRYIVKIGSQQRDDEEDERSISLEEHLRMEVGHRYHKRSS